MPKPPKIEEEAPIVVVEEPTPQEAVYSKADLMAGAAAFGVKPEMVAGALALLGKTEATRTEAAEAVKAFLEREV